MADRQFGKKIDTWKMRQGRKDFEIEVRMAVGAPEPFLAVHKLAGIEIRSADINKLQERVRAALEENERDGAERDWYFDSPYGAAMALAAGGEGPAAE